MIIKEFPYQGVITRKTSTEDEVGDTVTENIEIYNGDMDYTLLTPESGQTAQTAIYTISMPLTKDTEGKYIIPKKDDIIVLNEYGTNITFMVQNYMVSQLGGITITASRGQW